MTKLNKTLYSSPRDFGLGKGRNYQDPTEQVKEENYRGRNYKRTHVGLRMRFRESPLANK